MAPVDQVHEVDLGIDGIAAATPVASGATSTVYRAVQSETGRTVAIKVIHRTSGNADDRLQRELEVMGRLSGQTDTVALFASGRTANGARYLVMPFFERGSLHGLMADRGPLPWQEAAFLTLPIADAVGDLHDAGVVHRDVKPSNVLLSNHLRPRLADFGISVDRDDTPLTFAIDSAATTERHQPGPGVAFTPSFGAPETFDAVVRRPTVDVYSLGATLWALLAGRSPFLDSGGPNTVDDVLHRARSGEIRSPHRDTPDSIVVLLRHAMQIDPARRPVDGRSFAAELRRAIRTADISTVRTATSSPVDTTMRRRRTGMRRRTGRSGLDRSVVIYAVSALTGFAILVTTLLT